MSTPRTRIKVSLHNGEKLIEKFIRFNGNSLAWAQELLGRPVTALFHEIGEAQGNEVKILSLMGSGEIRALLYAGLRGAVPIGSPHYSLEEVGELMETDLESTGGYINAIIDAWCLATHGKTSGEMAEEAKADQKSSEGAVPDVPLPVPKPLGIGTS